MPAPSLSGKSSVMPLDLHSGGKRCQMTEHSGGSSDRITLFLESPRLLLAAEIKLSQVQCQHQLLDQDIHPQSVCPLLPALGWDLKWPLASQSPAKLRALSVGRHKRQSTLSSVLYTFPTCLRLNETGSSWL